MYKRLSLIVVTLLILSGLYDDGTKVIEARQGGSPKKLYHLKVCLL